jgi:hypothetical protein
LFSILGHENEYGREIRPAVSGRKQNLVRNVSSGKYFARFRSNGKLIWRGLDTDVLSTGGFFPVFVCSMCISAPDRTDNNEDWRP